MPHAILVVCAATLAFGVTELLSYAALPGLLPESKYLPLAGPCVASLLILWPSHRPWVGSEMESAILCGSLASLAIVDLRSGYVPNLALLPLLVLAIFHLVGSGDVFNSMLGALLVGGIALALHVCGKGASFGLGDVKLLGILGVLLGAARSVTLLGDAFIIGAAIGIALLAFGRVSRHDALPFVPMLGMAFLWQAASHAI